jgi:hypothetical protein
MKENFWFYFLAAIIILITGTQAGITYKRKRVTNNLIVLIANIIIFIGIIMGYFYQGEWFGGIGSIGVRISLVIALVLLVLFMLFYREIMQFINKRKTKNK